MIFLGGISEDFPKRIKFCTSHDCNLLEKNYGIYKKFGGFLFPENIRFQIEKK